MSLHLWPHNPLNSLGEEPNFCTGYHDDRGPFHNTSSKLQVDAVFDGDKLYPWVPALKIRERYRDFAILETLILGVLARQTRVATNTYEMFKAAAGKPHLCACRKPGAQLCRC